jgi:hypothetical protein
MLNNINIYMAERTVELKREAGYSSKYFQLVWKGSLMYVWFNEYTEELTFASDIEFISEEDVFCIKRVINNKILKIKKKLLDK